MERSGRKALSDQMQSLTISVIFFALHVGCLGLLHPGILRPVIHTPSKQVLLSFTRFKAATVRSNDCYTSRHASLALRGTLQQSDERQQAKETLEHLVKQAILEGGGWPFLIANNQSSLSVWQPQPQKPRSGLFQLMLRPCITGS